MAQDEQFGRLARRAYLAYHQDGLSDVLGGGILLGIGMGMQSGWVGPSAMVLSFIGVLYLGLKERVVIPRIGYAEFRRDPRREALVRVLYPVAICAFMLLVLLVGDLPPGEVPVAPVWLPSHQWPGLRLWMADKGALVFGIVALVVLGLIALGTGLRRMWVYAGLGFVFGVAGQLAGWQTDVPALALGGTVLMVGAVVFVRFLRSHPSRTGDSASAGGGADHAA